MAQIQSSIDYRATESLADDASHALPAQAYGSVFVQAEDDEGGVWAIEPSGNVKLVSGTTNTADTDFDTALCVFNNAGVVTIKNRLGATKTVGIVAQMHGG